MQLAIMELVALLCNSRRATKQKGTLFPSRKLCSEGLSHVVCSTGGLSDSLFGEDLYEYAMRKHSRPPLNCVKWLEVRTRMRRRRGSPSCGACNVPIRSLVWVSGFFAHPGWLVERSIISTWNLWSISIILVGVVVLTR